MFLCLAALPASARLVCTGVIPRLCREGVEGQERRVRGGESGWLEEKWEGGGGGGLAVSIFFGRTVGGGS